MDFEHLVLAFGMTLSFFAGRGVYLAIKDAPRRRAEIQDAALAVLSEKNGVISSGKLMLEVEHRLSGRMIGYGTFLNAMDDLVSRGRVVRHMYSLRTAAGQMFVGYAIPLSETREDQRRVGPERAPA